jgi:hypothetical protein
MGKCDVKGKEKIWLKTEYSKAQFMAHIRRLQRNGKGWEAELKKNRKSTKLSNSDVQKKIQTNKKILTSQQNQISIKIQTFLIPPEWVFFFLCKSISITRWQSSQK